MTYLALNAIFLGAVIVVGFILRKQLPWRAIAGATAYLTKPFTKDSLLKTVSDHVPQPRRMEFRRRTLDIGAAIGGVGYALGAADTLP